MTETEFYVCPAKHYSRTRDHDLTEQDIKTFVEDIIGFGPVIRSIKLTEQDAFDVAGNCREGMKYSDMWQVTCNASDMHENAIINIPYSLALPSDIARMQPAHEIAQISGVLSH